MKLDNLDRIAIYAIAAFIAWQFLVFVFDWLRTVFHVLP